MLLYNCSYNNRSSNVVANMEIQVPQQMFCPGDTVFMPLITRVLSNNIPFDAGCDLNNNFAIVANNWTYTFNYLITDYGDSDNNMPFTAAIAIDETYVNNNNSLSTSYNLGNNLYIYFNDVDHDCTTCTSGSSQLYNPNNGNYQFGIGECDTDTPSRPDCPSQIWSQPNWIHELVYVIPNNIVGPATIDFTGSYENGVYYEAIEFPTTPPLPPIVNFQGPFSFPQTFASGTVTGGTVCNSAFDSDPLIINVRNSSDSECGNGPLALSILNFHGQKRSDNISELNWSISSDENYELFLEYSIDAENYNALAKWDNQENSLDEIIEGSYTHTNPSPGFNYYRLKIIRENGSIEYSDVISLEFDRDLRSEEIKVYPNPVRDLITIENGRSFDEVEIYNIQGQLLRKVKCEQTNMYQIGTSELEPGNYFIRITGMDVIETTSFVKL